MSATRTETDSLGPIEVPVEKSLAMVTSLAPKIGYDQAAAIAKESFTTGRPVRQIAQERRVLPEDELEQVLDPRAMTEGGIQG